VAADARKSTQRGRLLGGMLTAANGRGYAGANVSSVIAHAGVSRPTFYDYFANKDECFLALHEQLARELLERLTPALAQEPSERALQAAVAALVEHSVAEPDQAQFLLNETLAGGPRALDARDRLIDQIERIVERRRADVAADAPTPDVPTRVVIGGLQWLLVPRLRRGERDAAEFLAAMIAWIESYSRPTSRHRWRTLKPRPTPPPSLYVSELPAKPPPSLPPGRARISREEIARNQRERIMYATATLAIEKGYSATTIADITKTARVDRRVFYIHFRDKQQAFLAAHELGFQQAMAVSASAYFSAQEWPDRLWQGILAGIQFSVTHPALAHVGYVESHAVGTPAVQRLEDIRQAFTIFLQEGSQYGGRHGARPQSRITMDAIAAAIAEIGYEEIRGGRFSDLSGLAYHAAYLCLAPFLGPEVAGEYLERKIPNRKRAKRRRSRIA
jgi:AcrR family transcriptional regulator